MFLQGYTSTSDIGPSQMEFAKCLFDFWLEWTNVPLLSCQHGHCPVIFYFYFFGNSRPSHSRSCDWLVAHSPSLHPTDKHSRLFLASLTQCWPLVAPARSVVSVSLESMGFTVVAINIAYCSLCGPVLNFLLRIGENQNILFLLAHEACVWTIQDATKEKKLKLTNILQMLREGLVQRTWSAFTKEVISYVECPKLLLSFDLYFQLFFVALNVWSALQPKGALFFFFLHFIVILQIFQVYFFPFCTVNITEHR